MTLDEQLAKATATGDELGRSGLLLHLTELECRRATGVGADKLATECYELFGRRGLELQEQRRSTRERSSMPTWAASRSAAPPR